MPSVGAHLSAPSFAEEMVTITAETQTHGSATLSREVAGAHVRPVGKLLEV